MTRDSKQKQTDFNDHNGVLKFSNKQIFYRHRTLGLLVKSTRARIRRSQLTDARLNHVCATNSGSIVVNLFPHSGLLLATKSSRANFLPSPSRTVRQSP